MTRRGDKARKRKGPLKRSPDLGRLVAEEDCNLAQYYIGRELYLDRALNMHDPGVFYMGPKGIGKSAVLQMIRLEKQHDKNRIIDLQPDDLAFSALANLKVESPLLAKLNTGQWLFKSLWDYVLLMELWERENMGEQERWALFKRLFKGDDEKRINKLFQITISDQGRTLTLTDRILQLVKEVELSAQVQDMQVTGKAKIEAVGNGQFSLLSEINHAVKTLPSMLRNEYYVLIDDLDLYWDNEPSQNAFIAALFLSLRRLSRFPVKFVVSIRQDIYRCLPLVDKDKSRDKITLMKWDAASIKQMVERRIVTALGCRISDVWGNLFPDNAFDVLAKHSMGRPRELIELAAMCVDNAAANGHKRVLADDIGEALRQYSVYRLGDLDSEYRFIYPGLGDVLNQFFGKEKEFPFEGIDEMTTKLACDAIDHGNMGTPWQWAGAFDERAEDFARLLLDIGFLQVKANRTAPPQEYKPDTMGQIKSSMWFAVHPMYAPGLRLLGT